MQLVVLCNRDLASCLALNLLLPELQPEHELQIVLSARVGSNPQQPAALQALKFAEQSLFNDVIFPLAETSRSAAAAELKTFTELAAQTGQPLLEFNNINSAPELEQFQTMAPDLAISIRYGVILKSETLAVPRLGFINLHSGQLPAYRGVMASFWAMLDGQQSLGTTLHTIDDASIDTGRIIATTQLATDPSRSYLWHVLALYEDGCREIVRAIASLAQGQSLKTRPQSGEGGYFSFPGNADLDRFQKQGLQLLDAQTLRGITARFLSNGAGMK